MSRSRKKHPHCGLVCYFSNKKDKQSANKRFRRINRQVIKALSNGRTYLEDGDEFTDIEEWGHDWWEYPSVMQLDEADKFKKIREVSDTWTFNSDGLWRMTPEWERVWDNSVPYDWRNRINHPKITIAEARRTHNWETLKYFIAK